MFATDKVLKATLKQRTGVQKKVLFDSDRIRGNAQQHAPENAAARHPLAALCRNID